MKNRNLHLTRLAFLNLLLPMLMTAQDMAAGRASGQLTVAGDKVSLQYAYARAEEGFFDKDKEDIIVTISNIPLSDKMLDDTWRLMQLAEDGTLKSIEVTIDAKQQPISVGLRHPAFKASPSGISSDYVLELSTFDSNQVSGRMYCKTEQDFFDTAYTFDFTFNAAITRKVEPPPPTAEEKQAAAKSPQATVYQSYITALNDGDVAALKKILVPDIGTQLDSPDQKEMLEFMKMLSPPAFEFLRIKVEGDSSTLFLGADDDGHAMQGTIGFVKQGDQWKMSRSDWKDK